MKKEASIQHALEEIERMPGIGPKSAQRILNWLLTSDDEVALGIAEAIERTGIYQGLYHVLGGVINPMEGSMPEDLHISDLMARLGSEPVEEVLVATNPDVEGETTASYLARIIKPLGIRVTRLASGLPVGGELEYADEVTLGRAIESRREL